MSTFAWDASDFDWSRGSMDLVAAHNDGIQMFTHKVSEGTTTLHTHTADGLNRARAAGIPIIGGYGVPRTPGNGGNGSLVAQVNYYLARLNAIVPWWSTFDYWVHQVDVEHWSNSSGVYDAVTFATGKGFADELRSRGVNGRIVIYASQGQYGDQFKSSGYPLWNASYGNNPVGHYSAVYPGDTSTRWNTGYTLLQYGSKTTIGSQSTCDANAFRGTLAQLKAALGFTEDIFVALTDDQTADLYRRVCNLDSFIYYGAVLGGLTIPKDQLRFGTGAGSTPTADVSFAMNTKLAALLSAIGAIPPLDEPTLAHDIASQLADDITVPGVSDENINDIAAKIDSIIKARFAAAADLDTSSPSATGA